MPVETDRRRDRGLRLTRTRRVSSIGLVVFVLAAGCGGGDTKKAADDPSSTPTTAASSGTTSGGDGDSAGSAAACGLLTPKDIDAALHLTVGEGEPSDEGSVAVCRFKTDDGSTTIKLSRYEPVGDLIKNTLAGDPKAKELPGVGDEAVDQIHIGQLTMRVGEIGVVVSVLPAPTLDGLVQLARTAAGRA